MQNNYDRPVSGGFGQSSAGSYASGDWQVYLVNRTFNIPVGQEDNFKVYEGQTVQFNGRQVRLGQDTINVPNFRAAINAGWVVPDGVDPRSVSAYRESQIEITPADTNKSSETHRLGDVQVYAESQVVGTFQDVRDRTSQMHNQAPQVQHRTRPQNRVQVTTEGQQIPVARVNIPSKFQAREASTDSKMQEHLLQQQAIGPQRVQFLNETEDVRQGIVDVATYAPENDPARQHTGAQEPSRFNNGGLMSGGAESRLQQRLSQIKSDGGHLPIDEGGAKAQNAGDPTAQLIAALQSGAIDKDRLVAALGLNPEPAAEKTPEEDSGNEDSQVVVTSRGIEWDLGLQWARRVKLALERFGWSEDILKSIAEVEIEAVATRIRDYIEDNFDDDDEDLDDLDEGLFEGFGDDEGDDA